MQPTDLGLEPNFQKMTVAAGGTIYSALTGENWRPVGHPRTAAEHDNGARRILIADCGGCQFVIAHADDQDRAMETGRGLLGPVYAILLDGTQLANVRAAVFEQDVAVYDVKADRRAQQPVKVRATVAATINTELGRLTVSPVTTRVVRKGMLFTTGVVGLKHLMVFRALADFDPQIGSISRHIVVAEGWDDLSSDERGGLTSNWPCGPDRLIQLAVGRRGVLKQCGMTDITERPARS